MIQRLNEWNPIRGDDSPYYTNYLRDNPEGFHFSDLVQDEEMVLTNQMWDDLIDYAERFYEDYEVVGNTLTDWLRGLQLSYDGNKMMFEKMLESLPFIKFDKGQTVTRTKSTTDSETGSATKNRTYSEQNSITTSGEDTRIAVGFDSSNEDPSDKSTSESAQDTSGSGSEGVIDGSERKHTGSETETVVTDRFAGEDSINYFERVMKLYPNVLDTFVKMFESNFTMMEVLIW